MPHAGGDTPAFPFPRRMCHTALMVHYPIVIIAERVG
jgi:hypothetical protein